MRRSERAFRLRTEFRFSFFAVLGFMVCTDREGAVLLCALACLLHELGHLTVMLMVRRPPSAVIFCGGGIHIRGGSTGFPAVIAGCAVNTALFLVFGLIPWENESVRLFGVLNLLIAAFNLLPIGTLDGRRLLELAVIRMLPPEKAASFTDIFERVMLVILLPAVMLLVFSGRLNFSAIIFFFYLLVVEILEKI
ncbi:MAG: site-2 protease family protein [Ruminiclostridium sp.]|nr:site-2 protease family protein [Ruminiclostridium sp.]